jgi:hypothetical protein
MIMPRRKGGAKNRGVQVPTNDDVVYGVYGETESTLVFIPRARALSLAQIWDAITTAKTWKDFRQKMPRDVYEEHMATIYDEANEPRPADGRDFCYDEEISLDWEWPSNPMDDMSAFLPNAVIALGRPIINYGDFFTIDPRHEDEVLRILRADGWLIERDDDLISRACGYRQL